MLHRCDGRTNTILVILAFSALVFQLVHVSDCSPIDDGSVTVGPTVIEVPSNPLQSSSDDVDNDIEEDEDANEEEIGEEPDFAHVCRPSRTDRPIIGIVAQELSKSLTAAFNHTNYTSYIGAAYVKFVESAGARVVPVLINQTDEYYEQIFNGTNGLLIPGGAASLYDSGYATAAKKIFRMAVKSFDESGDYYPIWGTCLGFEWLALETNNGQKYLTSCWSQDDALPLNMTDAMATSRIRHKMPEDVHEILRTENVTINFHRWCLAPDTFYNESNPSMMNFWNVLSTNRDPDGIEFVSLFESKHYPFWGSQFHPEKNAYEWTEKYENIPHSKNAVHSASFFAEFFVEECRKNSHQFPSREAEEANLIYSYSPFFTGNAKIDYVMQQCYLFEDIPFEF